MIVFHTFHEASGSMGREPSIQGMACTDCRHSYCSDVHRVIIRRRCRLELNCLPSPFRVVVHPGGFFLVTVTGDGVVAVDEGLRRARRLPSASQPHSDDSAVFEGWIQGMHLTNHNAHHRSSIQQLAFAETLVVGWQGTNDET